MTTPVFFIPFNKEDLLLADSSGQYYVRDLIPCDRVPRRLADCSAALSDDGFRFILNHFDPMFSVVHHAKDLDTKYILTAHNIVLKGISGMCQTLPGLMEQMDCHLRQNLLNAVKMYLFLLYEVLRSLEERFNAKTDKELAVDAKSRKKAIKNFADFDWDNKRNESLIKLHDFIHLPLPKLWDPPVADEDFVNLAANICYKTLEDPQVSQARLSYMKHTTFDILGTLIQKYGHGLSCTVKMVQLMKIYEHLPETLAQGAVKFVRDYQCRNFVREVIREITQADSAFENSSPKACSHFLIEIAKEGPDIILPSMPLLLPELENESYLMRNCVLGVIGEVVSGSLTQEHLSEEQKEIRDTFLDHLEEHLIDTNASVRGKVLKIWQKLCEEKAIPLAYLSQLLKHTVCRLTDTSWSVTRNAVQLYQALLRSNPFGDKLKIDELKERLNREEETLAYCEKEVNTIIPPTRTKLWDEISPQIIVVLQEALSDKGKDAEISEEALSSSLEDNIAQISSCLERGKYLEAFHLLKLTEKHAETGKQRGNKQLEWQVDYFHNLLRKIFVQFDESAEDGKRKEERNNLTPEQREAQDKLLKQQTLTQYYKDCIAFSEQLEVATGIINNLLFSAQPTVILDTLEFLTAAFQFGLKGALTGVKNMLLLVWSTETSVKEGVAAAYRQLYVDIASHAQGRSRAGEIVKNLCNLLKTLDEDQQAALELLLREWVKAGDMDKDCIQILWERFSLKLPDTSEDDSRVALILLGMVGGASPSILKTNTQVLVSIGLGERGRKDNRLARETCRTLLKLVPETTLVASNEEPFRFEKDDEVLKNLRDLLIDGFNLYDDKFYLPMASEAIDVIYQLSEHPDRTCTNLLEEFVRQTKQVSAATFDSVVHSNKESNQAPDKLVERLVFFIGHIAFRQWVHLDRTVFRELKRRNRIRELEAEKRRGDKQKSKNKDKRKSQANLNTSGLSRASETPLRKEKEKEDAADAELGEINADDAEAEYINHVCESEVLSGHTVLGTLSPIVVAVCTNPQLYTDPQLRTTACLSLTKMMLVSSTFCEEHLPLVFTMMEKSSEPPIRSKLVYAIGDLADRFPNLIEPWTKHLYARLQDKSSQVRLDAVVVLKHLITNEMVKVRGQISDMALCIVDAEERISVMASEFFRDLSKKGNTLYNVIPDIISRLSNPTMNVSEENFNRILEFLLPLIQKDKQMESLVDKLCQRFRASTSERQWSDIAFCLSLLQYSERSLRRLLENFQCYFDKLNTEKVYEAFESIIAQALKTNKPERKLIVEELQTKIDEALKRGLGTEDAGESQMDVDGGSQKENRVVSKKGKRGSVGGKKKRINQRRGNRGRRSKEASSSEDEEDEASSDEDSGPDQQLRIQNKNRRQRR